MKEEDKEHFLEEAELRDKTMKRFPSVLIGRFATDSNFEGKGYGSAVMDFIKTLFRINNRTGCRFLIVDAYNNHRTLHFYEKNGFKYLIEDEESEATYVGVSKNKLPLNTRLMYFDLLDIKVN